VERRGFLREFILGATNAIGTKHMIRLQEKLGFRMVFFSSAEVYGDYEGVMTEDVMIDNQIRDTYQMNDYAITNLFLERKALPKETFQRRLGI